MLLKNGGCCFFFYVLLQCCWFMKWIEWGPMAIPIDTGGEHPLVHSFFHWKSDWLLSFHILLKLCCIAEWPPSLAARMIYGNTESSGIWVACLVNTEWKKEVPAPNQVERTEWLFTSHYHALHLPLKKVFKVVLKPSGLLWSQFISLN